jgi:hypothetical protein
MTISTVIHPAACACCGDMLRARFDRRRFLQMTAGAGLMAAMPSLAFGAEGNYEAMLLNCIDPRMPEPTIKYMESRKMVGQYSQFTIAGASIGVVAPEFKHWSEAFWENLAASIQLHRITKVMAMNHRDCLWRGQGRQCADRNRDAQGSADGIQEAGQRTPAQTECRPWSDVDRRQGGDVQLVQVILGRRAAASPE